MYFGGGFLFSLPEPLILLITLIFHTHGNQRKSEKSVGRNHSYQFIQTIYRWTVMLLNHDVQHSVCIIFRRGCLSFPRMRCPLFQQPYPDWFLRQYRHEWAIWSWDWNNARKALRRTACSSENSPNLTSWQISQEIIPDSFIVWLLFHLGFYYKLTLRIRPNPPSPFHGRAGGGVLRTGSGCFRWESFRNLYESGYKDFIRIEGCMIRFIILWSFLILILIRKFLVRIWIFG